MSLQFASPARRLLTLHPLSLAQIRYILRSLLAASLALVVAYQLELDMPWSAATTVLLVLNPVQGAVLGKGRWRLTGTAVGMVVALALMASFAQLPWLFILAESLWLGVCVMAMGVLRHFRASGAAVAGYTIGLATLGALQHPELAFEHATGRAATVAVGVITLGVVSALLSRRTLSGKLDGLLLRLTQHTAARLARPDASDPPPLLAEIYSVDDLLAAARQESPRVAQQSGAVRQVMHGLAGLVAGGPAGASPVWQEVASALAAGRAGLPAARQRLLTARGDDPRSQAQIDTMRRVTGLLSGLFTDAPLTGLASPRFHRDWSGAWRNGLRAAIALLLASALWLVSGWPAGDVMLLIIAPYCALLSASPHPAAGARQFLRGTLWALPAALLCAFAILALINGLPLLLLVLCLFWLPGIYSTCFPQRMLSGLGYLVAFNTLTAAANPMVYDVPQLLNQSLAWLTGTALTLLAFQLMPRSPARHAARLQAQIRHSSLALLAGRPAPAVGWQQHRLAQLGGLLRAEPAAHERAWRLGTASLLLGHAVLRLRALAAQAESRPLIVEAQRRMAHRASRPLLAARHAQRAARHLQHDGEAAACCRTIAGVLQQHADYFSPRTRRARHAQ